MLIAAGFDPSAIRLIGNVTGQPPFKGTLRHQGWRVKEIKLAQAPEGQDEMVLQPAEVEAAIDIDDLAGAEGEQVGCDGDDGAGDVVGLAPAGNGGELLLENQVVDYRPSLFLLLGAVVLVL